jgi:hypothetical protein
MMPRKRSRIIDGILSSVTDDDKKRWLEERKSNFEKITESYQLGYLIGEKISGRLPILSTSGIKGNILMEIGEWDHYRKLSDTWFHENDEVIKNELWKEMREFSDKMEEKYLPKVFKTHIPVLNIKNMDEFKLGIQSALWDSDFCCYNIKSKNDFDVTIDKDYYFMDLTFKR